MPAVAPTMSDTANYLTEHCQKLGNNTIDPVAMVLALTNTIPCRDPKEFQPFKRTVTWPVALATSDGAKRRWRVPISIPQRSTDEGI